MNDEKIIDDVGCITDTKCNVLGIYGSHGVGSEVYEMSKSLNAIYRRWSEIIFIDDTKEEGMINNVPVMTFSSFSSNYRPEESKIVIAVGEPFIRCVLREKVISKGYKLETIIDKGVEIPQSAKIGNGVVINRGVCISLNSVLCDNVYVQPHVYIGHDSSVGEDTLLQTFSFIGGFTSVGKRTYIGPNSSIRDRISVEDGCIVGMGAVVLKNVEKDSVVVGNPAKVIRKNESKKVFKY